MTDAERLVAGLARRPMDWAALTGDEWDRFAALAIQHGVAPVAWSRLMRGSLLPTPAAGSKLREAYLSSAARNMRLLDGLGGILRALQAAGIGAIPLKGACLAEAVYGNIALRPMSDLDVLVRPDAVADAAGILQALGYVPEARIDPVAEQTVNHSVPLNGPGGLRVDLHWTIVTPRYHASFSRADLDGLWSRAEPATIAGVRVLMFSPADLLLHLCMHLSVDHGFDGVGLRAFVDLDEVTRRYATAIDWEGFAARANTWGIANGVRLALKLAVEWAGLELPPHVLPALHAATPDDETADWVRQKVFNPTPADLQSAAVRFAGTRRIANHLALFRDAMAPFRVSLAGMFRSPAASWRSLRVYSVRLLGYLGRHRRVLWRIVTRDSAFIADARKEARLREFLGWR